MTAALKGVSVIELSGLAPAPFAGMILSDFGADVIRVDKPMGNSNADFLSRGKRSIIIDLKSKTGVQILKKMLSCVDVLIEPFRPGVMEKLGLGPDIVMESNPRIIYARLTGFGQNSIHSKMAGHDINYLALSGALSSFGRRGENPIFPGNILADFGAGGLMCALGIALSIIARFHSGKGQLIDNAMVDGVAYLSTFLFKAKGIGGSLNNEGAFLWDKQRGENLLDSGSPFYEVYKTKDNKFISVGALEPQFYNSLLNGLELNENPLFLSQMDQKQWPFMKGEFTRIFLTKTRDEWTKIFHGTDACVLPVIEVEELKSNVQSDSKIRPKMVPCSEGGVDPLPSPVLSRTPARIENKKMPFAGQHTNEVLEEFGFSKSDIQEFLKEGVVQTHQSIDSPLKSSL